MHRLIKISAVAASMLTTVFLMKSAAQIAANDDPRDAVPENTPFDVPYGQPISLERAQSVLTAAIREAKKHDWKVSFSVYDSGGNVVALARMDGAQLSSPQIAEHKARSSVTFRRPTIFYENGIHNNQLYQLSVDGVIASRGGIPLIEAGKLIGAIGAAGGAGSQDQICAEAGAAVINIKQKSP